MLFAQRLWPGLADGSVTLAFRRWKRPTVRAGGTLRTPAGVLAIEELREIDPGEITEEDARRAGYPDASAVLTDLRDGGDRTLYRIAFHHIGEDPRVARRRRRKLSAAERTEIDRALARLDARGGGRATCGAILDTIRARPAERAAALAEDLGVETPWLKRRVRQLKELGLTESLEVGYRLAPRGESYLQGGGPAA